MTDLAWFRSVFEGGLTPGGRTVEDFDAALAQHDRELRRALAPMIRRLVDLNHAEAADDFDVQAAALIRALDDGPTPQE